MSEISEPQIIEKSEKEVMIEQEAKLRSKYPGLKPGGSSLLQKRLSKGNQKYFDSGDYNMAKARGGVPKGKAKAAVVLPPEVNKPIVVKTAEPVEDVTGDEIPTPETVALRKHSVHHQSKLAGGDSPS